MSKQIFKGVKKLLPFILILFIISGCSLSKSDKIQEQQEQSNNQQIENIELQDEKQGIDPYAFEFLVSQYSQAVIKTNFGNITIKFYNKDATFTVNSFLNLAQLEFYNGTKFHRVIKDFMIQGGDPNSKDDNWDDDGIGGPGYAFKDEINQHKLVRGSFAMANSGPNTNGSQFFVVTVEEVPWLDGKHTNFGYVIEGMDVVDEIEKAKVNEQGHPLIDAVIESIELIE